jgi:hypothetical protein
MLWHYGTYLPCNLVNDLDEMASASETPGIRSPKSMGRNKDAVVAELPTGI